VTLKTKKHIVFTSINHNYLGRALLLGNSIKKYQPEIHFVIVLIEDAISITKDLEANLIAEAELECVDEIITLEKLSISVRKSLSGLNVIEKCTAVKADAMLVLLKRAEVEFVTYLDPDIYVYGDISVIAEEHETSGDILLTPHLLSEPIQELHVINNEIAGSMNHGIFNLGFISAKKSPESIAVIQWWAERLHLYCRADYNRGIFTDQKWFDVAIGYFPCITVVRKFGWNMAPWNTFERTITSLNPPTLVTGESLLFFHYSKAPSKIFYEVIRSNGSNALLEKLASDYENELNAQNSQLESFKGKYFTKVIYPETKDFNIGLINLKIHEALFLLAQYFLMKFPKIAENISRKISLKKVKTWLLKGRVVGNSIPLRNLKLRDFNNNIDLLIISHREGGGVEEYLKTRVDENAWDKNWVVMSPSSGKTFNYYSNALMPSIGFAKINQAQELIGKANTIELHHLLGNEKFRAELEQHPHVEIFLHDRYFLSQTPFSDASDYLSQTQNRQEIEIQLNASLPKISQQEWIDSNYKILHNSANIFAPSKFIKDDFNAAFPALKVKVIEWTRKEHIQSARSLPEQVNTVTVISPSGIHKGVSVLRDVANILVIKMPTLQFNVIGGLSIYWENELKACANIHLFGQVPRDRIHRYLARNKTTVGWIPSLTGEAYSLALDDFLISGTPVFVSEVGALLERAESNSTIISYSPRLKPPEIADMLLSLINQKP